MISELEQARQKYLLFPLVTRAVVWSCVTSLVVVVARRLYYGRKGVGTLIDCGGFLCVSIQNSMDNVFMVVFSAFKGNMYNKRHKCTCLENDKV